MSSRLGTFMRKAMFEFMSAIGAAEGVGNRSRTHKSKKDKAKCPKKQRQDFRQKEQE